VPLWQQSCQHLLQHHHRQLLQETVQVNTWVTVPLHAGYRTNIITRNISHTTSHDGGYCPCICIVRQIPWGQQSNQRLADLLEIKWQEIPPEDIEALHPCAPDSPACAILQACTRLGLCHSWCPALTCSRLTAARRLAAASGCGTSAYARLPSWNQVRLRSSRRSSRAFAMAGSDCTGTSSA
jgi:hypothetical protein